GGRADERGERLVAAEHRVDAVEARRVVAVVRAGWEERRQIDDVRAERLDVVEMLLDPGQVAAVPLPRGCWPAPGRELVPAPRLGPAGLRSLRAGAREAIQEDLVDHRREVPVRPVVEAE